MPQRKLPVARTAEQTVSESRQPCLIEPVEPFSRAIANTRPSTSAGMPCCCNALPPCEHTARPNSHLPAIPPEPDASPSQQLQHRPVTFLPIRGRRWPIGRMRGLHIAPLWPVPRSRHQLRRPLLCRSEIALLNRLRDHRTNRIQINVGCPSGTLTS